MDDPTQLAAAHLAVKLHISWIALKYVLHTRYPTPDRLMPDHLVQKQHGLLRVRNGTQLDHPQLGQVPTAATQVAHEMRRSALDKSIETIGERRLKCPVLLLSVQLKKGVLNAVDHRRHLLQTH